MGWLAGWLGHVLLKCSLSHGLMQKGIFFSFFFHNTLRQILIGTNVFQIQLNFSIKFQSISKVCRAYIRIERVG